MAANTLHRCLTADDLSADKLQAYQRSWKRRLGRELRTGHWARRVFEMMNDRQLDRLLELIESSGLLRQLEDAGDLSFDWHADVVTRVFNQRLVMNAIRSMKLPFRSGARGV
jgi:flavin-dependent dehydrogenase